MTTWDNIAWFPICVGLTAAGAVLSVLIWRRSGVRRGLRALAWSAVPLALYLTGAIEMLGRIGSAVASFATAFVFSPRTWAGLILFGVAAVAFLGTGGLPRPRRRKAKQGDGEAPELAAGQAGTTGTAKAPAGKRGAKSAVDDDLRDVEEILRKHGIS
jgi:hypothetical protein